MLQQQCYKDINNYFTLYVNAKFSGGNVSMTIVQQNS